MHFRTSRGIVCFAILTLAGCRAGDQQNAADRQPSKNPTAATSEPAAEVEPALDAQPASDTAVPNKGQSFAGWYMEQSGQGMFQACGDSKQFPVSGTEELRNRASAFGLEENTPVYVRVSGVKTASGDAIEVTRIEQFGSDTPVRDCGLTGVVIPAPAKN